MLDHQPTSQPKRPTHGGRGSHGLGPTSRTSRGTAALLLAALIATLTPTGATATQPPPAAASTEADDSKLMLVMDSSGSMAEPAGGGTSKIEAAKESLHTVIDTLPSEQPLGLRVYGAQVRGESDPNACTDSQLAVPVEAGNRDRLRDAVDGYKPVGATPIGYALQEAGDDLGNTGRRNIILVSDGESTCQPDPCTVSRQLREDGIDLRIDVVGLNVTGPARRQLQCVAQTGGGVYYDAHDPQQLTDSLTKLTERAARPYETIGQPVTGAKNWSQAPTIRAGDWQDELPTPPGVYDGQRIYRIERQLAQSTLFVSAAYRAPDGASNLELSLAAPDGTECGSGYDSQLFTDGMLLSVGARAGQLGDENQPIDADDPCLTSEHLAATVTYSDTEQPVPVELRVTELPEITNLDDLPEASETPEWDSPEAASAEVTGGTSFGDAEQLKPGGYTGTIVPGETLTYSVDVGWGEQLNAAAHIDQLTGTLDKAVAGQPSIYMQIFGPARLPAGTTEASADLASDATLGDGGSDDLGLTTGPVTYPNIGYRPGAAQAGTYTVTLFLEDNDQNPSLPVPYDLGIGVTGDATDEPVYDEQPFSVADNTIDDTGTAAPPPGPENGDGDDSGVSGLDWIIGLVLLAAVAIGILLKLRNSRTPATTTGGGADPSLPGLELADLRSRTRQATGRTARRLRLVTARLTDARIDDRSADGPTLQPSGPQAPPQDRAASGGQAMVPVGEPPIPRPRTPGGRQATAQTLAAPVEPAHDLLGLAQHDGLGLVGPGAQGVATGLMLDLLCRRTGEVIIPAADLAHLLDEGLSASQRPSRLAVTGDLDQALDRLETEILTRTRQANDDHDQAQPGRGGPILLLTRPAAGARDRLAADLRNGASHRISGIVVGAWRDDATLHVAADGTVTGSELGGRGCRLPMVGVAETRRRLATLTRQAPSQRSHPLTRPQREDRAESMPADGGSESEAGTTVALDRYELLDPSRSITTAPDNPQTPSRAKPAGSQPQRDDPLEAPLTLCIFGPPELSWRPDNTDIDITGRLTRRQLELLCFLALHPDGVNRDTAIATLWPDSPYDNPANGLHLTTSRLRAAVATATDDAAPHLILLVDGRYQLNPSYVAVDYWAFIDVISECRNATSEYTRKAAYEDAVDTYVGRLADGIETDWIVTSREGARRDMIDAASRLAQHLVDDEPARALDILERARTIDPDNELIYRDIIRLQHKLGRPTAIRSTLDLLKTRLTELDLKPDPETIALADAATSHQRHR